VLLATLFTLCLAMADAQTRRRRRPRRVNRPVVVNPVIVPPGEEQKANSDTERVISTADETLSEPQEKPSTSTKPKTTGNGTDAQEMQQSIHSLSNQVNRLNDKLSKMQENDKALLDMERLTRAELADLQSRLEQTEFSLKPENIDRAGAGYGTTHPEEARDARRRALENERARLQAQIRILETSRTRLEQALQMADDEVDSLRRKMEQQRLQESAEPKSANTPKP